MNKRTGFVGLLAVLFCNWSARPTGAVQMLNDGGDGGFLAVITCALNVFSDEIVYGQGGVGGVNTKDCYVIENYSDEQVGTGGANSKYEDVNGKVKGSDGNDYCGVTKVNLPQIWSTYGSILDEDWEAMEDPARDAYMCGIAGGVLVHESIHELVYSKLEACLGGSAQSISIDCMEAVTKIMALNSLEQKLLELSQKVGEKKQAVDACKDAIDEKKQELEDLNDVTPPDQAAISALEEEISILEGLLADKQFDLDTWTGIRDGLSDLLQVELEWLNELNDEGVPRGEAVLAACNSDCINEIDFPIGIGTGPHTPIDCN